MSRVKVIKRFLSFIPTFAIIVSMLTVSVRADSGEGVAQDLYYIVYNENDEIVEEGLIPANSNGRYSWNGSITLSNGWYTAFLKRDGSSFYTVEDTYMVFKYFLDKTATVKCRFYKDVVENTTYPTTWSTQNIYSSGSSVSKIADQDAYYFVGITNVSSDDITISNVSFVFGH